MKRLTIERDAIFQKYEAAKAASETGYLNYQRQKKLLEQGLSSETKYEKAKITYKKLLSAESTVAANLAKSEVRLSRQEKQKVLAPREGTILRVLHGSGSVFVKEGDTLATFVPKSLTPAVEIYIDGNDLPLVYPGRHVRLQFEGWPAVQFSGWPSVAIGTFGGEVAIIDPSASKNGKFRVIVRPTEKWPDNRFLRQGTRAYGWILLNSVKLGYELWRQFNGFPPSIDDNPYEQKKSKKKSPGKIKKDKDYKDPFESKDAY
jgi:biotin carboxyl carrier protein